MQSTKTYPPVHTVVCQYPNSDGHTNDMRGVFREIGTICRSGAMCIARSAVIAVPAYCEKSPSSSDACRGRFDLVIKRYCFTGQE